MKRFVGRMWSRSIPDDFHLAFDNAMIVYGTIASWEPARIVIEKSYDLFSEGNEVRGRLLYNRRARCAVYKPRHNMLE